MIFSQSFVAFVALALTASATPVVRDTSLVTLSFAKHIHLAGVQNIIAQDQARAKWLKSPSRGKQLVKRAESAPVTNTAISYLATVDVGNPPQSFSLVVDTGSSNTWVGANSMYVPTATSVNTSQFVAVSYGSGFFSGTEFIDQVAFGSFVIEKQSIGVASAATGFVEGVDGILGIGPIGLTLGTLNSNKSTQPIPTVTDNLRLQGAIPSEIVAVSFEPTTQESVTNGKLTFGGVDKSRFIGPIKYVELTNTTPAASFWGIDQSIAYGDELILSSTAGIVDTGTTLLPIATDAFKKYEKATGAKFDNVTGLLSITPSQYSKLQDLNFEIGGTTFALTPNAQIWPRSLNAVVDGQPDSIYLIVADIGAVLGEGLDFINGQVFLERFYSVFDTANGQFGIANTPFTNATTN